MNTSLLFASHSHQSATSSLSKSVPVVRLSQQTLLPQTTIPLPLELECDFTWQDALHDGAGQILVLHTDPLQSARIGNKNSIGCLAELIQHVPGRGLALIKGIRRVRYCLRDREAAGRLLADIQLVADHYVDEPGMNHAKLRQQLIARLVERCPELAIREMSMLLECELPLGLLCDLSAAALGLSAAEQDQILQELRVDSRCRYLLERSAATRSRSEYSIPAFGMN